MSSTKQNKTATIKTAKGNIKLELFPDVAPNTVENFIKKANSDHYKELTFHRVEDWVIQGGDPIGNGTGGGDQPTELSDKPFTEGSVGIARGGDIKISNDSQFFICTTDAGFLTGQYTIFGQVASGMDIAKKIEIGDKIQAIDID
jgi:cyclophilin family peptidyl-prolyl cis-trans isomerase